MCEVCLSRIWLNEEAPRASHQAEILQLGVYPVAKHHFCSKHIKSIKAIKASLSEVRSSPGAALPVLWSHLCCYCSVPCAWWSPVTALGLPLSRALVTMPGARSKHCHDSRPWGRSSQPWLVHRTTTAGLRDNPGTGSPNPSKAARLVCRLLTLM